MLTDTITVRIPRNLRKQLESICKEEGLPVSDAVRESLDRYISIQRFRKLRERILPFAEAQGVLTDEDVFREIS